MQYRGFFLKFIGLENYSLFMQEVTFITQTLSLLVLLIVSSFTYLLSKKIKFPYTVLLVLIGLLLIPLSHIPVFAFINDFELTPNILFLVFLPTLLFEAAYNINYRQLLQNWKSIWMLAIFWLLISAWISGVWLYYLLPVFWFDIPFLVCLMFWILISATDPVAVLSIFKSMWAPRRLTILFEWESLFNDGTAVAIFAILLWIIIEWSLDISGATYAIWAWKFASMLFWWIAFGAVMWILFSKILGYIKNHEEVEIVLTMVMAHITFISAELITHHIWFLPISGVISTVIASVIIWNYWRYKISPRVEAHMQKFWEFFAFVSNSIVFILMWLILSSIEVSFFELIVPIFIAIIVVAIARVVAVYIPLSFINVLKLEEKIPNSWQVLLSWWSLRWALALMMVLLIPGPWDLNYSAMLAFQQSVGWTYNFSIKDFLLVLTIGSIMFTLFIKAPTISILMRYLKLDSLHTLEKFEYIEWKILCKFKVLQKLRSSYKKAYITKQEYIALEKEYSAKLKASVSEMKDILSWDKQAVSNLIHRAISLHALGIEKQYLKELFYYNELDEKNFKYIFRKIEKQIERLEHEDIQLRSISWEGCDYDIFSKLAIKLYKNHNSETDTYIRNRSRVIITRKVIKELKALAEIDFWFDKTIFQDIIELYAGFNKTADKKRMDIFTKHEWTIHCIDSNLIGKSILKLEEKVLKDLYKKEIITPKLYIRFMDEIEEKMYRDVKDIQAVISAK